MGWNDRERDHNPPDVSRFRQYAWRVSQLRMVAEHVDAAQEFDRLDRGDRANWNRREAMHLLERIGVANLEVKSDG